MSEKKVYFNKPQCLTQLMPDSSGGIVVPAIRHGLTRECNGFRKDKAAEKLAESEEDML